MHAKFVVLASLIFAMFLGATAQGLDGKDAKTQYPGTDPQDQYLLLDHPAGIAALAGASKEKIADGIKVAYTNEKLPDLEPGATSYMMDKQSYLNSTCLWCSRASGRTAPPRR